MTLFRIRLWTNGRRCMSWYDLTSHAMMSETTSNNNGNIKALHYKRHVMAKGQWYGNSFHFHNSDVIMDAIASQITSLIIVYSTVYSSADQRKHQSSASLAFVPGSHRWPMNSPHKWPVTREMFPFDNVIMHDVNFGSIARSREVTKPRVWVVNFVISSWHLTCVFAGFLLQGIWDFIAQAHVSWHRDFVTSTARLSSSQRIQAQKKPMHFDNLTQLSVLHVSIVMSFIS